MVRNYAHVSEGSVTVSPGMAKSTPPKGMNVNSRGQRPRLKSALTPMTLKGSHGDWAVWVRPLQGRVDGGWFVFPGALPPAIHPVPFQGTVELVHGT